MSKFEAIFGDKKTEKGDAVPHAEKEKEKGEAVDLEKAAEIKREIDGITRGKKLADLELEDLKKVLESYKKIENALGINSKESLNSKTETVKMITESLKELLEKGANMNYVARGLAGVNTEEAQKFRKLHFNKDATLWAKSYASDSTIINGIVCQYGFEGSA